MKSIAADEVFRVSTDNDLGETGGGHNQKGVDFQRAWAISRMFEMEDAGEEDFLLFEENKSDSLNESSPVSQPSRFRMPRNTSLVSVAQTEMLQYKMQKGASLKQRGLN